MAASDRRFTYRLDLLEDQVRVSSPSSTRIVVADLSASGSGLIVNPDDLDRVTAEPATFDIGGGQSFVVRLAPVRVSQLDRQLRVGARFQDLPLSGMRVLSEFLIREFLEETRALGRLLEDPRTITTTSPVSIRRHLKRCLVVERRPLRVYDHGTVLPLTVRVERIVDLGGRPMLEVVIGAPGLEIGREYTFAVARPGAVTHFRARPELRSENTFLVPLPDQLCHGGFRDSVRTSLDGGGDAFVRFEHPRLPGVPIGRPLLDLSARGFAFASDPESDLLFPGDRLARVELFLGGETYQVIGAIRSIAPHRRSDVYTCGVEVLEFADVGQEVRFQTAVFQRTHPRAVMAEPPQAAGMAWDVLQASGYVELWTRAGARQRLQGEYARSWTGATQTTGRLMLVESGGKAVGTVAASLLYPKTWLVHQLGVDRRESTGPAQVLSLAHELYSGVLYLFQNQQEADYFAIFAERDRRWSQTLYDGFVAEYPDRSAFAYDQNRVFRCDVTTPVSRQLGAEPGITVVRADAARLLLASEALRASSSPLLCDAMAYGAGEIGLEDFARTCRELGCERERHVYVALENDTPIAALIAESGGEGVNIFGLMNHCTIASLGTGPVSANAKRALLREAMDHFLRQNRHQFLFFDETDADVPAVELLGFEYVSEGMRFIASKRVVPAWLSYLEAAFTVRAASQVGRDG